MTATQLGRLLSVAALATLTNSPATARADVVQYAYSGTLYHVRDDAGVFGGQYSVGDAFSGYFSYDTDTVDQHLINPALYVGIHPNNVVSSSLSGHSFTGVPYVQSFPIPSVPDGGALFFSPGTLNLVNNADSNPVIDLGNDRKPELSVNVYSSSLVSDPLKLPAFFDLNGASGDWKAAGGIKSEGNYFELLGTIDSFSVIYVPEPTTFAMAGVGFVGLLIGLAKRRRSRRTSADVENSFFPG